MTILKAATVPVTGTGSNGSVSGNADSETFVGSIEAIAINYHANAPATTDLTITDKRTGQTIYTKANSNTDAFVAPRLTAIDLAAADILSSDANGLHPVAIPVDQGVNVAVAQANTDTNQVVVTVYYRK